MIFIFICWNHVDIIGKVNPTSSSVINITPIFGSSNIIKDMEYNITNLIRNKLSKYSYEPINAMEYVDIEKHFENERLLTNEEIIDVITNVDTAENIDDNDIDDIDIDEIEPTPILFKDASSSFATFRSYMEQSALFNDEDNRVLDEMYERFLDFNENKKVQSLIDRFI